MLLDSQLNTEDLQQYDQINIVAGSANKSDITMWLRKERNLLTAVNKLNIISDVIVDKQHEQQIHIDTINVLRSEMVINCIHPIKHLVINVDGNVVCKFCNREFSVIN